MKLQEFSPNYRVIIDEKINAEVFSFTACYIPFSFIDKSITFMTLEGSAKGKNETRYIQDIITFLVLLFLLILILYYYKN